MSSPSRTQSPREPRPAVDEWGIYDPQQAGVDAVIQLLERRDAAKLVAMQKPNTSPKPSLVD